LYRQIHPRANLSIECNSDRVPADGKYYILRDGSTIASFRTIKAAQARYNQLIEEMTLPPLQKQETKLSKQQILEEYYSRVSNNALFGTSWGSKSKKTGRFHKSR